MNLYQFNQTKFAERLTSLRKRKGYSQLTLGLELGITGKSYGKYEQQCSIPDCEKIVTLANLYNVSIDYLLCGVTSSPCERLAKLLNQYSESEQEHIVNAIEALLIMLPPK